MGSPSPPTVRPFEDAQAGEPLGPRVRRAWWVLPIGLILGGATSVGLTYYAEPEYEAKASVLLQLDEPQLDPAAAFLNQGPRPLDVMRGLMLSNTTLTRVAEAHEIERHLIGDHVEVSVQTNQGQIEILGRHGDSDTAISIAQTLIDSLETLGTELELTQAQRQAALWAETVATVEADLQRSEDELVAFQSGMSTSPLPDELGALGYQRELERLTAELESVDRQLSVSRASRENIFESGDRLPTDVPVLEVRRQAVIDLDIELQTLRIAEGPSAPDVLRKERELEIAQEALSEERSRLLESLRENVDRDIAELEGRRAVLAFQVENATLLASAAPEESMQLQRIVREAATLKTVLSEVRGEYERARVAAETERVRWSVVDPPYLDPPHKPANKTYTSNGIAGGALGLLFGLLLAVRIGSRRKP